MATAYFTIADQSVKAEQRKIEKEGAITATSDKFVAVVGNNNVTVTSTQEITGQQLAGKVSSSLIDAIGEQMPVAMLVGMGMLMVGAMGVLFMTWVMIVCEACVVMFGGILFLGFAGTRFTMPFSQGYLQYAINVGVKYFSFWLVMSIEAQLLASIGTSTLAGLGASLLIKLVAGQGILTSMVPMLYPGFNFAVMTAIAYGVPSFANSWINGTSSLSASQAMNNVITGVSMASQMLGKLLQGNKLLFSNPQKSYKQAIGPQPSTASSGSSGSSSSTSAPSSPIVGTIAPAAPPPAGSGAIAPPAAPSIGDTPTARKPFFAGKSGIGAGLVNDGKLIQSFGQATVHDDHADRAGGAPDFGSSGMNGG
jgi:hypothetical protein